MFDSQRVLREAPAALTRDELIELGRQVLADPTHDGWLLHGRPITNVEMSAVMEYRRDQRRKAEEVLDTL